jgi:hypothetical protein
MGLERESLVIVAAVVRDRFPLGIHPVLTIFFLTAEALIRAEPSLLKELQHEFLFR